MNFDETLGHQIRSYIENRSRALQSTIETTAQNRAHQTAVTLEKQIDQESETFIADVTTRLNTMRDEIKAHRPRDKEQLDYEARMAQYRQFVSGASIGFQRITDWVNRIFEKIIDAIKTIVMWIVDQAQNIINILELIRSGFNQFIGFLYE